MTESTFVTMALAIVLSFSHLSTSGQPAAPRVNVAAELTQGAPYVLRFSVRSLSQGSVRLYTSDLPWGNVSSLVLEAVTATGRRLQRDAPIDDPDIAVTELRPGGLMSGLIDLKKEFPHLTEIAGNEEVLIFWSYRLVTTAGERSGRTGGGCSFLKSVGQCWNAN
jgi:hypothetical protein